MKLEIEKITGKRCDFIVTYKRSGRLYYDGVFAPSEDAALAKFMGIAKTLGWRVKDVALQVRQAA